jgi:hypothetical protein
VTPSDGKLDGPPSSGWRDGFKVGNLEGTMSH